MVRNLTKKQVEEGILELNFVERKTSIGHAQIPLRTLCSKHYYEKEGSKVDSGTASTPKLVPRIATTADHARKWNGFRAQLVKSDMVRGTVNIDVECTSVPLIQDLLSAYKTYFVGVDNLMHLAAHNPVKLASYITADVLEMLRIATASHHMSDSGSPSGPAVGALKKRNRASARLSKAIIDASHAQALAALEKAFQENEPDPEDRDLLLALWRHFLSCNEVIIRSRLVACGLFKIAASMLALTDDAVLVLHFLEGLKYFFILPDAQSAMTKKKKKSMNIAQRVVNIVAQGASTPTQAQVVLRAMDLFCYFDEPDAMKALVEYGLINALVKVVVDTTAFLALRTKAMDLLRILPAEFHKTLLASGILTSFSELIASPSTRSTHHSYLTRVLSFLLFLEQADVSNLASDGIFKNLIGLIISKTAIEQNKLITIQLLSLAMDRYAQLLIDQSLPANLIHVLIYPQSSCTLRTAVMNHLALPPYQVPDAMERLISGGVMQSMFELLSTSFVEEESSMARKFLSQAKLGAEQLLSSGMLTAMDVMLNYENLLDRYSSPCCDANLDLLLTLVKQLGPLQPLQTSAIPRSIAVILKRCINESATALEDINTIDPKRVVFDIPKTESQKSLPHSYAIKVLQLVDVLSNDAFFAANLHTLSFFVSLERLPDKLPDVCRAMLDTHPGWIEKIDHPFLFTTIETMLTSHLDNIHYLINIMRDLPPGYGHAPLVLKLLTGVEHTKVAFESLMKELPEFEAYLEIVNSDGFVTSMLCPPKDPKAPYFYKLIESEAMKNSSLREHLHDQKTLLLLLGYLSDAISLLKTSSTPTITKSATVVRDFAFKFLSTSPQMEQVLSPAGSAFLIDLASEPASGAQVACWALKILDTQIASLYNTVLDMNLFDTLWNIVNSCDISVIDSAGDSETLFATKVSTAAWKLLCKLPSYLDWLHSLPVFIKTVTTWFFCKQPDFQMMALASMEPVRWARAGCSTRAEFEAWRLNLNKGRLAFCSALKDANLDEVSKLARSFAHNHVIPEDLTWITNSDEMRTSLQLYLSIEEQLRPTTQTEQAKEFSTLVEWLKFLRLCKNSGVKRRFIGLLDTFHDSLFFLPDSAPANTNWNDYYRVTDEDAEIMMANKLKRSQTMKKSTAYRSVQELRSSNSRALVDAVSKGSKAPPVIAKWRPNTAAHFQLLRFWQFSDLTSRVNLTDVSNYAHSVYELCYDSYRHGFSMDNLKARTDGLNKLMFVAHLLPPSDVDSIQSRNGVFMCFYIPSQISWSVSPFDVTSQSRMTVFSWRNMDHASQASNFDFDSNPAGGYMISRKGTISLYSDRSASYEMMFSMSTNLFSISSTGKWYRKLWNNKQTSDIPMVHVQVFRLANVTTNNRITVMTRKGFGEDANLSDDDAAAAASSTKPSSFSPSSSATFTPTSSSTLSRAKSTTIKVANQSTSPSSSEDSNNNNSPEHSSQDSESFMNRHLAKTLNQALSEHFARIKKSHSALSKLMPHGPTPTWIRMFRYSARDKADYSTVNFFDIVRDANASSVPLIGIVKIRNADSDDDSMYSEGDSSVVDTLDSDDDSMDSEGDSSVVDTLDSDGKSSSSSYAGASGALARKSGKMKSPHKKLPPTVFGFYIHGGIDPTASSATTSTFIRDPMAMLFSLSGPSGKPIFAPVDISESQHAYRFVNNTTMQFGLGTDLYLNFTDHSGSFANPGCTYMLPDGISFMSREAITLFTYDAPTTWQFEDIELYFRTNPKSQVSLPSPALGHLLRLLGQEDVTLLQQIRWRLKYLMLSGSLENKRQTLDEIRRAQMADMKIDASDPINNFTKRIEHPGVGRLAMRVIAVNGLPAEGALKEHLHEKIFNPGNLENIVAPSDVIPFDVTFAILPAHMAHLADTITAEEVANIPIESLPYLTHVIVASRRFEDPEGERAKRAVVFAGDSIPSPSVLNEAYSPTGTPIDDYAKIIKANAKDHLRWYEQHAPSSLDPSAQFRIGPILKPADEKLSSIDTGLVSKSEDAYWSFLSDGEGDYVLKARTLKLPGRQAYIEDYLLDSMRAPLDPIALIQLDDKSDVGDAALSAPVRSRYVTLRFLPNANNKLPLFFSAIRLLGYHPENNHFLAPPNPMAMEDVLPIYKTNMIKSSDRFKIEYGMEEDAGILRWLRETKHQGNLTSFQDEFILRFSHHLFDPKTMKREQFFDGSKPTTFFWGGSAPTWFTFSFTNYKVAPNNFMLRHGYGKNNSFISNFVFQGSVDFGKTWTDIAQYPDHYHSYSGQAYLFHIDQPDPTAFYTTFRIFQKGAYFMGPGISGSPYMCISEFEVFGTVLLHEDDDTTLAAKSATLIDVDEALAYSSEYGPPLSDLVRQ